jgi:uncharacterized membrane protein YphA (DoxX/SURF4 family)
MFGNLLVAWAVYRHFWFCSRGNWHGEMTVVYMIALLALVFTGPGKYSLDWLIEKKCALSSIETAARDEVRETVNS